MRVQIYVGYSEKRNQLWKATCEVVEHLPKIGDKFHGWIVKAVWRVDPDVATWTAFPDAHDYDYFQVFTIDPEPMEDEGPGVEQTYVALPRDDV